MLSPVSVFSGVLGAARSAFEALQTAAGSVAAPSLNAYAGASAVALAAILSGSGCAAVLEGPAGTTVPIEAPPPRAFIPFGQTTVLQFPYGTSVENVTEPSWIRGKKITLGGVYFHDNIVFVPGDELFFTDEDPPVLYRAIPHAETIIEGRRCPAHQPIDFVEDSFACGDPLATEVVEVARLWTGIERRFQVPIGVLRRDATSGAYAMRADPSLAPQQLRQLARQLRKVPPDFLRSFGLHGIILTGPINDGGVSAFLETSAERERVDGRMVNVGFHVGGMYLYDVDALYHEVFHGLDVIHGGLQSHCVPADSQCPAIRQNRDWTSLDPVQNSRGVDEEQPDYANILFNLDTADDPRWRVASGGMTYRSAAKEDQMRRWLFAWSGGRFNDQYWEDLRAGRVGVDYWR